MKLHSLFITSTLGQFNYDDNTQSSDGVPIIARGNRFVPLDYNDYNQQDGKIEVSAGSIFDDFELGGIDLTALADLLLDNDQIAQLANNVAEEASKQRTTSKPRPTTTKATRKPIRKYSNSKRGKKKKTPASRQTQRPAARPSGRPTATRPAVRPGVRPTARPNITKSTAKSSTDFDMEKVLSGELEMPDWFKNFKSDENAVNDKIVANDATNLANKPEVTRPPVTRLTTRRTTMRPTTKSTTTTTRTTRTTRATTTTTTKLMTTIPKTTTTPKRTTPKAVITRPVLITTRPTRRVFVKKPAKLTNQINARVEKERNPSTSYTENKFVKPGSLSQSPYGRPAFYAEEKNQQKLTEKKPKKTFSDIFNEIANNKKQIGKQIFGLGKVSGRPSSWTAVKQEKENRKRHLKLEARRLAHVYSDYVKALRINASQSAEYDIQGSGDYNDWVTPLGRSSPEFDFEEPSLQEFLQSGVFEWNDYGDYSSFYEYFDDYVTAASYENQASNQPNQGGLNAAGRWGSLEDAAYTAARTEVVGENRSPISCWSCERAYWAADSTGDLYADCRTYGTLVTCPRHKEDTGADYYDAPMSCQVEERRFFGVVSELKMGCKQTRACQTEWEQNKMAGSVYGRRCRSESSFGISECRQCCSTDSCRDGTDTTVDSSLFDTDAEWWDTSAHSTYVTV